MKTFRASSSKETKALAAKLAKKLSAEPSSPAKSGARVIALYGDLGAGKTTFTQGLLKALGARGRFTSPTFVLMKKYAIPPRPFFAYHIDAYRFHSAAEASPLGLKEILKDPRAIVIVEWPERLKGMLPRKRKSIRFRHGKTENERLIAM